jgi:hypothetical protein
MPKDNNYSNTIHYCFNMSKALHAKMMYMGIEIRSMIYGLSFCSVGFASSNLLFAMTVKFDSFNRKIMILAAASLAPLAFELILPSSDFCTALYLGKMGFAPNPRTLRNAYRHLHNASMAYCGAVLGSGFLLVTSAKASVHHVRQLAGLKWRIMLGNLFICLLCFDMFYPLPAQLLWISRVAGYVGRARLPLWGSCACRLMRCWLC